MSQERTRESQYQDLLTIRDEVGVARLGLMTNQLWHDDPRHLVFILARYKFVAKMLQGKETALEVGCGDAFATRIVQQVVPNVTAIDFDPIFIEDAKARREDRWPIELLVHDILEAPLARDFEAAYSVDVLEHIAPKDEERYLANIVASVSPDGVVIIGTPSLESQAYASKQSRLGHINCKKGEELKELMERYFHNVFIFSMNDEVVHTGFQPMAQYLFAVCSGKR